jgi:hypothetical protein
MLTKRGLEALAAAFGEVERSTGADAQHVSHVVMAALVGAGVVTPKFDRGRFAQAVEDARPVPYTTVCG